MRGGCILSMYQTHLEVEDERLVAKALQNWEICRSAQTHGVIFDVCVSWDLLACCSSLKGRSQQCGCTSCHPSLLLELQDHDTTVVILAILPEVSYLKSLPHPPRGCVSIIHGSTALYSVDLVCRHHNMGVNWFLCCGLKERPAGFNLFPCLMYQSKMM